MLTYFRFPQKYYPDQKKQVVEEFLKPCLQSSKQYLRRSGYFSSGVFEVARNEFLDFFKKGGVIQLICSPHISERDFENLSRPKGLQSLNQFALESFCSLLQSKKYSDPAKLFGFLVESGKLKLKFAEMSNKELYHCKTGTFIDANNSAVTFSGSGNETFKGWYEKGNGEEYRIDCSWASSEQQKAVFDEIDYFEKCWNSHIEGIRIEEMDTAILQEFVKVAKEGSKIFEEQFVVQRSSHKPDPFDAIKLGSHQKSVVEAWERENFTGIIRFCTGAGKTISALHAMRMMFSKGIGVLVVVPSELLLKQWEDEINRFFPLAVIEKVGGGNSSWKSRSRVQKILRPIKDYRDPRVVLAVINSARSPEFLEKLRGEQWAMIVDELHNIGSPENRVLANSAPLYRLGLSATPERYNDPVGTKVIFDNFGPVLKPIIDIPDAQALGRLVPYQYYAEFVSLTAEEQDAWDVETKKIRQLLARIKSDPASSSLAERLNRLRINRSRIAKKAESKITRSVDIIEKNREEEQSWLIYCEDTNQLEELKSELEKVKIKNIYTYESSSSNSEKKSALDGFEFTGGILLSMRCLDEGVDLPSITHCIILASSQNPRQFIQRRGRGLRTRPGKDRGYIWDLIVKPRPEDIDTTEGLLAAEISRALEFCKFSGNQDQEAKIRQELAELLISNDKILESNQEIDEHATA